MKARGFRLGRALYNGLVFWILWCQILFQLSHLAGGQKFPCNTRAMAGQSAISIPTGVIFLLALTCLFYVLITTLRHRDWPVVITFGDIDRNSETIFFRQF